MAGLLSVNTRGEKSGHLTVGAPGWAASLRLEQGDGLHTGTVTTPQYA
jgi:hypothetical protein